MLARGMYFYSAARCVGSRPTRSKFLRFRETYAASLHVTAICSDVGAVCLQVPSGSKTPTAGKDILGLQAIGCKVYGNFTDLKWDAKTL